MATETWMVRAEPVSRRGSSAARPLPMLRVSSATGEVFDELMLLLMVSVTVRHLDEPA